MEILLDFIHIYIIRKKYLSDIQIVTDIALRHFKIKKMHSSNPLTKYRTIALRFMEVIRGLTLNC
jgi:hypothetical protein